VERYIGYRLYTEQFYAIIPTFFPCLFRALLIIIQHLEIEQHSRMLFLAISLFPGGDHFLGKYALVVTE